MKTKNRAAAILFILAAAFFMALQSCFVRLAGDLPAMQKCFVRNIVTSIFAFVILKRSGVSCRISKKALPLYLARSVCGVIGILGSFYTIDRMLLADATILNKLSPFFAIICSFFFLGEKIKPAQALGVAAAFLGAVLVVKPGFSSSSEWFPAMIGVLGGLGAGAAYTIVRMLGQKGEPSSLIVFFFAVFSSVVCLPSMIFDYHPMTAYQTAMLVLGGFSAMAGQFALTAAYTRAPAREISVYDYTQVLFSALFGFFLFGQIPDALSVVGYIVICGASVALFVYNRRNAAK